MGNKKRSYEIVETMTGNPPKPTPILTDNGKVIGKDDRIVFNKNHDKMKKVDFYVITFQIKDFKDSSLRFVNSLDDAMWVQKGAGCPQSPSHLPGVIWVDEVDPNGEWIVVFNMDLIAEDFQFTLNFVDKSVINPTQADYVMLDPGGSNQNQGMNGYDRSSLRAPIASSIAGALVGLATAVLATNSFVASSALIYGVLGAIVGAAIGFAFERR